jgi:hypothetical protein
MASQWYYQRNGEKSGPYSSGQLKALADAGQIAPVDLIWKNGMAGWVPAQNLKGLFGQPLRPVGAPESAPSQSPTNAPGTSSPQAAVVSAPTSSSQLPPVNMARSAIPVAPSLGDRFKAAAKLVAKHALRLKLTSVTLPAAYRDLGRHIYGSGDFREQFADLYAQIDAAGNRGGSGSIAQPAVAASSSMSGSGTPAIGAKVPKAVTDMYGRLGQTVYAVRGTDSGPPYLVTPIAESVSQIQLLDGEIAKLSAAGNGQRLTPKAMLIGTGVVGLAVMVILLLCGGASSSSEDARNVAMDPQKFAGQTIESELRMGGFMLGGHGGIGFEIPLGGYAFALESPDGSITQKVIKASNIAGKFGTIIVTYRVAAKIGPGEPIGTIVDARVK